MYDPQDTQEHNQSLTKSKTQNYTQKDNLTDKVANIDGNSICSIGLEHHLIGLSPQYWSYTPLFIVDIQSLKLINGIT